jgi:tetratricopeptide (TPR) repeat protein
LRVAARTSSFYFKGEKVNLQTVGETLHVNHVLEGSVRKAGNTLRITAQLIEASTDTHLWAEKYNGTLDDVFDLQEKVSYDITTILKLKLTADERNRMALRPINNFEAFDFYLKAYQKFWMFTEDALNRGLKYLQQAADIIGENDLLYSAMALIYFQFVNIGSKQENYIIKAEEFAQKALALNPDSAKAHHVMGIIALRIHGNPHDAVRYLKRAIAIEPSLLAALISLIATYCYCGKISAAIPLFEKLKRVNPLSLQRYYIEGVLHFYDGKYEAALEPFFQSYKIDPVNPTNMHYALTLAYCNKYNEAISVIDKRGNTDFEDLLFISSQMLKFALLKMNEKVLEIVTPDLKETCKRSGALSHIIALILALTGEKDQTLDLLENAVDSGFLNYPLLFEKDPWLENIRGEERFTKLMKRVKREWENFKV